MTNPSPLLDPVEFVLREQLQRAWRFRFDGEPCPEDLRELWAALYSSRIPFPGWLERAPQSHALKGITRGLPQNF